MHITKKRRHWLPCPCPDRKWWSFTLLVAGAYVLLWAMTRLVLGMQAEVSTLSGPEPTEIPFLQLWSEEGATLRFSYYMVGVLGLCMMLAGLVLGRRR